MFTPFLLAVVSCSLIFCEGTPKAHLNVKAFENHEFVTLENGYTKVSFSTRFGFIDAIFSDFSGSSNFTENILSTKFGLEIQKSVSCHQKIKPTPVITWLQKDESKHVVKISNLLDCQYQPLISETWTISLSSEKRSVEVDISGQILRDADDIVSVTHSAYLKTASIYGLFDRGVVQMMDKQMVALER